MYTLRIGSNYLAIPKNVPLPYTRNNALFQFAAIDPSFTYPIELPNTPALRKVFGAVHDLSLAIDLTTEYEDAALCINKNDEIVGVAKIISANQKTVQFSFKFGISYLATKSKDIKLPDLFATETIAMTIETQHMIFVPYNQAHNGFYFSINGTLVFVASVVTTTSMADLEALIIAQWPAFFEIYVHTQFPYFLGVYLKKTASPTLNPLAYSRNHWDNGEGGPVDGWPYNAEEITPVQERQQATLVSADLGVKYELPTIHAPSFYNGENSSYLGFLNVHRNGTYIVNVIQGLTSFETTLLPCMRFDWVLKQVFEKLGIEVSGDFFANAELMAKHFIIPRSIDKEIQAEGLTAPTVIEVPISELLPDITIRQFIASQRVEHGLDFDFDLATHKLLINFSNDVLDATITQTLRGKVTGLGTVSQEKYSGLQVGYALNQSDLQIKAFVPNSEDITEDYPAAANIAALHANDDAIFGQLQFVNSKNAWFKKNGQALANWEFFGFNLDHYRDTEEVKQLKSDFTPLIDLDVLEFEFPIKSSKITAVSVAVGFTSLAFKFELWDENGGAPVKAATVTIDADDNKQATYNFGESLYNLFSLQKTQVEYYINVIEVIDDTDQPSIEKLRKTIDARVIRVPSMEIVGYLPAFDLSDFDKSPRFSVYRGMQAGSTGTYPMSSLGRHLQDDSPIAGANISFVWNKVPNNLMTTFYPNYVEWLKFTKGHTLEIIMSKPEFLALNLKKKFNHRGATFLIKSMQGNLANEDKIALQLKVQTV